MVALDLWDHLSRRAKPMLAVYTTATVAVTVAAGTRCAQDGLTGPLDAKQLRPGPEAEYPVLYCIYFDLLYHTCSTWPRGRGQAGPNLCVPPDPLGYVLGTRCQA